MRVTISLWYFGNVEHVANLSLAHCAAAVGSVELLYKCNPHELLEASCNATTMHLAASFGNLFYVSQFSGTAITPFELRVALSRPDQKKRSIMHYACGNGHSCFVAHVSDHLPYKNMVIPLLHTSDANGCTPTACAVVGNHADVLRLLDSRHLFKEQPIHFTVNNDDGKIIVLQTSLAHFACEYGCTDVLQFLHEKNCNLQSVNGEGRTPAMVAAMFNKHEVIKLLVSWKVSMETVPEMAIACMQCDILQCLANSGNDITAKGRDMLMMEDVKCDMISRGAKLAIAEPPEQTVSAAVPRIVESWDGEYWVEAARKLLAAGHQYKHGGDAKKSTAAFTTACAFLERAYLALEAKLCFEDISHSAFYMVHCLRGLTEVLDEMHERKMSSLYGMKLEQYLRAL